MRRGLISILSIVLLLTACGGGVSSQVSAQQAPEPDTVAAPELRDITIVFAGDAMQHKAQLEAAARGGGRYDYTGYFSAVEPYIKSADYAVVNLETTLGASGFTGYPCFCSPDAYAAELKKAGFDMMLTANNHTLDRHDAGLRRTIAVLDTLGVAHLGTYTDAAQRRERLPMIIDIEGYKVAFLNYTYGTNGIRIQGNVVVDYINRDLMKRDIAEARAKGAEIVCVAVHWGEEYKLLPNASQRSLAAFLADEGADLIIGSHPHVIQPMEVVRSDKHDKDVLVVYSLGNFISAMRTTDTRGGVMVKATLSRDGEGKARFAGAEYLPVYVVRGTPGGENFHLVVADSCDVPTAKAFLRNAYGIFDKHNVSVERSQD